MATAQRVLVELLALEREIVEADYVRRSDAELLWRDPRLLGK